MNQRFFLLAFFLFVALQLLAQGRTITNLNQGWQFTKKETKTDWSTVNLPHSWNTHDVMDDKPGYYRGPGWYRRTIPIQASDKKSRVYLRFEAAAQYAEVSVNGHPLGTHTGGYNAFQFDISPWLDFENPAANEVLVLVDNSYNEDIAPLTADFTFFGGLYRDVWLIKTPAVHFRPDTVYGVLAPVIQTPLVTDAKASLKVLSSLINTAAPVKGLKYRIELIDPEGRIVKTQEQTIGLRTGESKTLESQLFTVNQPELWSTSDPRLYRVRTKLLDTRGQLLDELNTPFGFRYFTFDAGKGFFLNGKPLKLVGASRHQDRPFLGNAVPDSLAVRDVELIKEMGGNFLRVAHYPQDPVILETCDRLGILASVEIPVVNEITESAAFFKNCERMQLEMIKQNYNHPSVVIWCYMNEVLLRGRHNNDRPRQDLYFQQVRKLAQRLDSLTRKTDPSRFTMIAHHGDFNLYQRAGLNGIPMILGWNLYSGWYGGVFANFSEFLDRHHRELPGKPLIVSEYGADADPRIRSLEPVRFDKSLEYALMYHQYYLNAMLERPFVQAAIVWNLADFNSETREETMPHINNKGLLQWDRSPKDLYFYYQAKLLQTPMVRILGRDWPKLTGRQSTRTIRLASNMDSVELWHNGHSLGWQKPADALCNFTVNLVNGPNEFEARAPGSASDRASIVFDQIPDRFSKDSIFHPLNILLGANRFYLDEEHTELWMPDQPYQPGSFGSIGGRFYKQPDNNRLPYGTDKNILGTFHDPVYQTQLTGIREYKLDVPDGTYELILHFAELSGVAGTNLVYNLSEGAGPTDTMRRIFDVQLNEEPWLQALDIRGEAGPVTPLVKKKLITVSGGKGIHLRFDSIQGEPVLNALQLRKVKQWSSSLLQMDPSGRLSYQPDSLGNIIPDFSGVGYKRGLEPIPGIPELISVSPGSGDDQATIQRAIDQIAKRKPGRNGFRGAVLIKAGDYKIPGSIRISQSGIVLKGEGEGSRLIATGTAKRALIQVMGTGRVTPVTKKRSGISQSYVPVGTRSFEVENPELFQLNDRIILRYLPNARWIRELKMDQIEIRDSSTKQWKQGEYDLDFERTITGINGNKIIIDYPVMMAIEFQYGGAEIFAYHFEGRIHSVGVENLLCESEFSFDTDEDHAWTAVQFNRVENAWARQVTAKHFAFACIDLGSASRNVTVDSCRSLQPRSEVTGGRRYAFNNDGQLNLIQNCFSSEGRHDYVTGARVCGPNVFYNNTAVNTFADTGPHHRWAIGTLYDNVVTDGEINAQDRGNWGSGHGWAGVNQYFWNCSGSGAAIQRPWISGNNYAIGFFGNKLPGRLPGRPDGYWEGRYQAGLNPGSLFRAQSGAYRMALIR